MTLKGLLLTALLFPATVSADELKLAVTTSFSNSGLAEILLPEFEAKTGIKVAMLVVGTGQALALGEAGDVDAVLVHSKAAEERFVEAGHATHRREIMYNDFVVIGPAADPASIQDDATAIEVFAAIAGAEAAFVSRGDESGTHKAELALWDKAAIAPAGEWYNSVGQGMGAALNTAAGMGAYILSDRASWLNFGNKGDLVMLFEGDSALFNQYAYLPINPDLHPSVNAGPAEAFESWLVSDAAKDLIDGFAIDGQQLFHFNAVAN